MCVAWIYVEFFEKNHSYTKELLVGEMAARYYVTTRITNPEQKVILFGDKGFTEVFLSSYFCGFKNHSESETNMLYGHFNYVFIE